MRKILTAGVLAGLLAFGLTACDDAPLTVDVTTEAGDCTECLGCDADPVAADGVAGDAAPAANASAAPASCPSQLEVVKDCFSDAQCDQAAECDDAAKCDDAAACDEAAKCDVEEGCKIEAPKVTD